MERLASRAFVFRDAFETHNGGRAYQFIDTCRNGSWRSTTNRDDLELVHNRNTENSPRWWRVVHYPGKGWAGYLFRERMRERQMANGGSTLRGTKLPQAVVDRLAAIVMLTCSDKPMQRL